MTGWPFYYSDYLKSAKTRALGSNAGNQEAAGHWMTNTVKLITFLT